MFTLPAFDEAWCHVSQKLNTGCRWWLAVCDWVMPVLSAVLSTRVGRRRKFGEVPYGVYKPGKWLWIDSNRTNCYDRNAVEGYFGSEFPAICNYCEVIPASNRNTLKILEQFLRFLKRPLTVKFSKFCSESFHRDTDRRVMFKFRETGPSGNRWNRALLTWQKTKFRLAFQLSLLRR